MNEYRELPKDLVALQEAMADLPANWRKHLMPALDRVQDGVMRRKRILHLIQEALSDLRMQTKYLVFDLEATRRERDEYRI